MSRAAKKYYASRARRLGIQEVPSLLDGSPRHLLNLDESLPDLGEELIAQRFRAIIRGVSKFAVRGTIHEYPEARGLRPDGRARTVAEHALVVAEWLACKHEDTDRGLQMAYTESVGRFELPNLAIKRATVGHHSAGQITSADKQVYLTTRAIHADRGCPDEILVSLVHGDYRAGEPTSFLTPRYFSCQLLPKEAARVPEYWNLNQQA